jgi:hypothetical protein
MNYQTLAYWLIFGYVVLIPLSAWIIKELRGFTILIAEKKADDGKVDFKEILELLMAANIIIRKLLGKLIAIFTPTQTSS